MRRINYSRATRLYLPVARARNRIRDPKRLRNWLLILGTISLALLAGWTSITVLSLWAGAFFRVSWLLVRWQNAVERHTTWRLRHL